MKYEKHMLQIIHWLFVHIQFESDEAHFNYMGSIDKSLVFEYDKIYTAIALTAKEKAITEFASNHDLE